MHGSFKEAGVGSAYFCLTLLLQLLSAAYGIENFLYTLGRGRSLTSGAVFCLWRGALLDAATLLLPALSCL